MQHIPKQSHYVRCPVLELLCTSLCGLLAKKFGDPCFRIKSGPRGRFVGPAMLFEIFQIINIYVI